MEPIYRDTAKQMKALSDAKRLRIIDMLSCGELCACKILENFDITQPTLSHDMKVLVEAGLVKDRRDGKNTYYSLDMAVLKSLSETMNHIFHEKADCICKDKKS
ncbi:MAG: winged helix-turn-helix transcriptional regulator [Lachnospiraceae bacterium]|nr:winged helix-turn-helix transcriptional regulator [Lachnospiraceae bacterium]